MIFEKGRRPWVVLTGATGMIGQVLLSELLTRGHRVLCLVRGRSPATARRRVADALRAWRGDADVLLERGDLAVLRADFHAENAGVDLSVLARLRGQIGSVIHAAGSTRFAESVTGEPALTNVVGTRNLLTFARQCDCRDWHLISSAYIAGVCRHARERFYNDPPDFRNAYERSKWIGERDAAVMATDCGATLTIYRPSIVAGHGETGQASRFTGVYYLFRAASLLARTADSDPSLDRHDLPLRIPGRSDGHTNLICVEDVARTIAELFAAPAARGGIYHLTHPEPPTNCQIKEVLERFYDIGGGEFVGDTSTPSRSTPSAISNLQSLFDSVTRPVSDYLFNAPVFDRTCVGRFESRPPVPWTDERLTRLMTYAESVGWRAEGRAAESDDCSGIAYFFREHLPNRAPLSKLGQLRQLNLTVQFVIGSQTDGQWSCRFGDGRIVAVTNGFDARADVTYVTGVDSFWAAVSGEKSGAEIYLSGDARIEGDIERGLKFATILNEFVVEFPCRRDEITRKNTNGATREPAIT